GDDREGRGANRRPEARGKGPVQHPRGRRGALAIPGILPPQRPRSPGTDRAVHAEGSRYGIRFSGAAVVGPEGEVPLNMDDDWHVSKRRAKTACCCGDWG